MRTIIQMVQLTRLDCAIASAGIMRMALAQAIHHARHRTVFQKHLADQPMMQAVLADMALEVEGATALVMRLCRSFDLAAGDPREAARARLLTAAVKYWVCKTAPAFVYEAMECLGGNGYVEESVLPRLYREAPVNAIWEGSGNVMCLDVLRALAHDGEAAARRAGCAGGGNRRAAGTRARPPSGSRRCCRRRRPRRGRAPRSDGSRCWRRRRRCARRAARSGRAVCPHAARETATRRCSEPAISAWTAPAGSSHAPCRPADIAAFPVHFSWSGTGSRGRRVDVACGARGAARGGPK